MQTTDDIIGQLFKFGSLWRCECGYIFDFKEVVFKSPCDDCEKRVQVEETCSCDKSPLRCPKCHSGKVRPRL